MSFQPAYLEILESGELDARVESAYRQLAYCDLCARYCRVDRRHSIVGAACHTDERAVVYKMEAHCGRGGEKVRESDAGAIFFSFCNMSCVYCKKREVSQKGMGWEVEPEELANMMLAMQEKGSRNISLVSASHVVAQILAAVAIAARRGLRLPLIFESDAYDSPESLALLDGVVDVYMPDLKYGTAQAADAYSHAPDYVEVSRRAVTEMYRQVGELHLDGDDMALRGLLIRHLILPGNLDSSRQVLKFVAELAPRCHIDILANYQPCRTTVSCPPLNRALSDAEHLEMLAYAGELGLHVLNHAVHEGN